MKKLKSSLLNMVLSLTIIAVVAGALLAWVNDVTKSRIEKINERKLSEGICSVMGAEDVVVDSPQEKDEYVFYPVRNRQGSPVGTAVSVVAQGFGGDMKILVGFSPTGEILGYTVLSNAETPGLGAKVTTWFQKNHEGDIVGKNPGKWMLSRLPPLLQGLSSMLSVRLTSSCFMKKRRMPRQGLPLSMVIRHITEYKNWRSDE